MTISTKRLSTGTIEHVRLMPVYEAWEAQRQRIQAKRAAHGFEFNADRARRRRAKLGRK